MKRIARALGHLAISLYSNSLQPITQNKTGTEYHTGFLSVKCTHKRNQVCRRSRQQPGQQLHAHPTGLQVNLLYDLIGQR